MRKHYDWLLKITNIELREKLSEEYIKTFWSKSSAKIEDDIADAAKGLF